MTEVLNLLVTISLFCCSSGRVLQWVRCINCLGRNVLKPASFQDCRDFTTGPTCSECVPGYYMDGRGGCLPENVDGESCDRCDPRGSAAPQCPPGGQCECKENTEGSNCDRCRAGTFHLSATNPRGCSSCYCSGVTDDCNNGRLFWSTKRMPIFDENHGIRMMDQERRDVVDSRELIFKRDSWELEYKFPADHGDTVYYWSLPQEFTGNKMTAYGGNMTITQRYETSVQQHRDIDADDIILIGNGLRLNYREAADWRPGDNLVYRVPMYDDGWRKQGGGRATREDFLRALANIEVEH